MMALYTFGIYIYTGLIRLATLFSDKASEWVKGRITQRKEIQSLQITDSPIWFHCSSLGEFEQARPIIEFLKQNTKHKILLTFFSPSGYLPRQKYAYADWIYYLPTDTKRNAIWWLNKFKPRLLIITKYDFWFNMIASCQERAIPQILISATFRPEQYFFTLFGRQFANKLKALTRIFVQDADSKQLLNSHGFYNVEVGGDSRVDRVIKIAKGINPIESVEQFCQNSKVLVFGSSWEQEESILFDLLRGIDLASFKIILVPHDVSKKNIESIKQKIPVPYSVWTENKINNEHNLLLIDTTGILNKLYYFAWMAVIGGGFKRSIHNILEPMAFKVPICIGPNFNKFPEAQEMVKKKGAFVFENVTELNHVLEKLNDSNNYKHSQVAISNYLTENQGATGRIVKYLEREQLI